MRLLKCSSLAFIFALVLSVPTVFAHDIPLQTVVNSFVKIDQNQADLVVRVPLDLLRNITFPLSGNVYDTANSNEAMQQALVQIARSIPIWEDGVRLRPQSAAGKLALPIDRSFESYDAAVKSISEPTPP